MAIIIPPVRAHRCAMSGLWDTGWTFFDNNGDNRSEHGGLVVRHLVETASPPI